MGNRFLAQSVNAPPSLADMSASTKHALVSRQLLEDIAAGKYHLNKRLPSEAQLVERFGVSRPTITRAMRDLEAADVVERRAGSGTYLKSSSGAFGKNAVKQLGLIVPDFGRIEIFEVICGELAGLARTNDFHLVWGNRKGAVPESGVTAAEMLALCDEFIERNCAGVFFAPMEHLPDCEEANRMVAEKLRHAGIPMVLIDRDYMPHPARSEYDLVGVNHFRSGYLLAEHLIKLGCKHVAFITRPLSASTVDARIAGARSAFVAHELEFPARAVLTGDPSNVAFLRSLMAGRQYDAVICANDFTAAQLLQGLQKLKVDVPKDLRIVGFDDVRYATLLSVPLTTIHQPCRDIAVVAFRAMQERMSDPTLPARMIHLTPHLVVRESCGAYLARV